MEPVPSKMRGIEVHETNMEIKTRIQRLSQRHAIASLKSDHPLQKLSESDITLILQLLDTNGRISYSQYKSIINSEKSTIPTEVFSPSLFYQLPLYSDNDYWVRTSDVDNYLREYYFITSLYGSILEYCKESVNSITNEELIQFINTTIRSISITSILTSQFLQFYTTHVHLSLLFFEDRNEHEPIPLIPLILSDSMRNYMSQSDTYIGYLHLSTSTNWFTPETAFKIYAQFTELDSNKDGLLSWKDIIPLNGGKLIPSFAKNVIKLLGSGNGLNYELYLRLMLAYSHLHLQQAQQIIFELLDKDHKGYLTQDEIKGFIEESIQIMAPPIHITSENYTQDIFDHIHPQHPNQITLTDLVRSGSAEEILQNLINSYSFKIKVGNK
ncbi:hypothetical protein WA171_007177 [Blastocystis sp. BT1]